MADYTDPNLPEDVKKIIHTARIMLYSDPEAIQHAITGAQSLTDSASPILYMVLSGVEQKLGKVEDPEALKSVIVHLAGGLVELAHSAGDPDAQDMQSAVMDITGRVMEMVDSEDEEQQQGMDSPQEEQAEPMQEPPSPFAGGLMDG